MNTDPNKITVDEYLKKHQSIINTISHLFKDYARGKSDERVLEAASIHKPVMAQYNDQAQRLMKEMVEKYMGNEDHTPILDLAEILGFWRDPSPVMARKLAQKYIPQ